MESKKYCLVFIEEINSDPGLFLKLVTVSVYCALGIMTVLYWNLILSHSMPHSLVHPVHHPLAMVSNFSIATFHQLCSATKIPWSPCLISSELTSIRAM